jgi:hypothetical protein
MIDCANKNRLKFPTTCGEKHPSAKLTNKDIYEIRNRLDLGETQIEIAKDYPVGRRTISHIKCRDKWKHI